MCMNTHQLCLKNCTISKTWFPWNQGNFGVWIFLWKRNNKVKVIVLCSLAEAFQASWFLWSLILAHNFCFPAGPAGTAGQRLAAHSHLNEWGKWQTEISSASVPPVGFISLLFIAAWKKEKKRKCLKSNSCSLWFRWKWSCQWSSPAGSSAWRGCRPASRQASLGSRLLLSPSKLMGHVSPCCVSGRTLASGVHLPVSPWGVWQSSLLHCYRSVDVAADRRCFTISELHFLHFNVHKGCLLTAYQSAEFRKSPLPLPSL